MVKLTCKVGCISSPERFGQSFASFSNCLDIRGSIAHKYPHVVGERLQKGLRDAFNNGRQIKTAALTKSRDTSIPEAARKFQQSLLHAAIFRQRGH